MSQTNIQKLTTAELFRTYNLLEQQIKAIKQGNYSPAMIAALTESLQTAQIDYLAEAHRRATEELAA